MPNARHKRAKNAPICSRVTVCDGPYVDADVPVVIPNWKMHPISTNANDDTATSVNGCPPDGHGSNTGTVVVVDGTDVVGGVVVVVVDGTNVVVDGTVVDVVVVVVDGVTDELAADAAPVP